MQEHEVFRHVSNGQTGAAFTDDAQVLANELLHDERIFVGRVTTNEKEIEDGDFPSNAYLPKTALVQHVDEHTGEHVSDSMVGTAN